MHHDDSSARWIGKLGSKGNSAKPSQCYTTNQRRKLGASKEPRQINADCGETQVRKLGSENHSGKLGECYQRNPKGEWRAESKKFKVERGTLIGRIEEC